LKVIHPYPHPNWVGICICHLFYSLFALFLTPLRFLKGIAMTRLALVLLSLLITGCSTDVGDEFQISKDETFYGTEEDVQESIRLLTDHIRKRTSSTEELSLEHRRKFPWIEAGGTLELLMRSKTAWKVRVVKETIEVDLSGRNRRWARTGDVGWIERFGK